VLDQISWLISASLAGGRRCSPTGAASRRQSTVQKTPASHCQSLMAERKRSLAVQQRQPAGEWPADGRGPKWRPSGCMDVTQAPSAGGGVAWPVSRTPASPAASRVRSADGLRQVQHHVRPPAGRAGRPGPVVQLSQHAVLILQHGSQHEPVVLQGGTAPSTTSRQKRSIVQLRLACSSPPTDTNAAHGTLGRLVT